MVEASSAYNDNRQRGVATIILVVFPTHAFPPSLSQDRARRFKRFANLFYKFSPVLMRQCPLETVEAWKQMRRNLKPRSLIPALVQCNQPADPKQVSSEGLAVRVREGEGSWASSEGKGG